MRLSISKGNIKLGSGKNAPHSISLPPGLSCPPGVPCLADCYARKRGYNFRKTVKNAWDRNWRTWQTTPSKFEQEVCAYLMVHEPGWFRWHVGGDIPNADYLLMMQRTARAFPNVKFLAFTKQYEIAYKGLKGTPPNLQLVLSMWPGWGAPLPDKRLPHAWMQDGAENRVPADALECPGCCEECGMCWSLSRLGLDVVFRKH